MASFPADPPARLLVVDDTEMNRDMLSRRLGRKGYQVEVAESGARALERIRSSAFDLVLLDITMPGMDGYEVLETIREEHGPSELPVIMATARTGSEDVVRALKMGANDYVTKPFDFPVVLARVQTQVALKRSQEQLSRAHHRMKQDLEAAARIQRTLLPSEKLRLEGARCAWRYLPCDELAGDTLNVVPLGEGLAGLFLLDVSGHGVPAALLSVALSRLISDPSPASSILWTGEPGEGGHRVASPLEVVEELSRRFPYDAETHQYFTMVYGVLDVAAGTFTHVSAGHTPVVHLHSRGEVSFHGSTGPPVALIPAQMATVAHSEEVLELEAGDRLYLMSDGIPEVLGPGDEEFGMERVGEVLDAARGEELEGSLIRLLGAVREWESGGGLCDDVSILGVEITG